MTKHEIVIINRSSTAISGVKNVDRFDDENVILDTSDGILSIFGSGLMISNLSLETGELTLKGKIDELQYFDGQEKKPVGLFGKVFR